MTDPKGELELGAVVDGKYRLERVLGQGGMGIVFAATDVTLDRQVAIKALLPELTSDDEAVARFVREARAVVRLMSEHTIRVYEVGELASGMPYMVMEFLVGGDVEKLIAVRGFIPVGDAVDYVLQAIEGVAEAHAHGVVHRDLKPANMFLAKRSDGHTILKVLDFGLATAPRTAQPSLTATSDIFGSPAYMSPQQLRGSKGVDARTDIWSLGVCLYQMVTGKLPFDAENVSDIIAGILKDAPRPAHEIRPDVPVGLSQVIARCLEKDLARRYSSLAELATGLEGFASRDASGIGDRLRRILLWTGATEPLHPGTERLMWQGGTVPLAALGTPRRSAIAPALAPPPPVAKPRWPFAVALVLGGVLAGGGGVLVLERLHSQNDPPATTRAAAGADEANGAARAAPPSSSGRSREGSGPALAASTDPAGVAAQPPASGGLAEAAGTSTRRPQALAPRMPSTTTPAPTAPRASARAPEGVY